MKFEIEEELKNQLIQYLASKPLGEVMNLFNRLQVLKPVQSVPQEPLKVVSETK